jgi:hypothetical protein
MALRMHMKKKHPGAQLAQSPRRPASAARSPSLYHTYGRREVCFVEQGICRAHSFDICGAAGKYCHICWRTQARCCCEAAVSDRDARLVMYCWKLDAEGNVDYAAFSALGMTAYSWMAGTCSLSKQRLFSAFNFSFFSALSIEQERTLLQEVDVSGMTFASIMRSAGIALDTVKYLQITRLWAFSNCSSSE